MPNQYWRVDRVVQSYSISSPEKEAHSNRYWGKLFPYNNEHFCNFFLTKGCFIE